MVNYYYSVYVFVILWDCGLMQDVDEAAQAETTTTTTVTSELICETCACADKMVDCANRNIIAPFEYMDWVGLRSVEPINVDLSGNPMQFIKPIASLPTQVLNLSNCDISNIEDGSFMQLENLTSLDLSKNKISTKKFTVQMFTGTISPGLTPKTFKYLRYLDVSNNDIHSLPQDVFTFINGLTYLDLSGNPLAYIDQVTLGAISTLVSLEELKLSSCDLEALPDGLLRRQRRLKRLDLSNNRFTAIPSTLQEGVNLVYLNFDKNPVELLDSETAKITLPNLQELSLNRLSKLQNISKSALGGLQNLVTLRLSYNPRLTNVDPYFLMSTDEDEEERWPFIKEFYINNNNISTIDSHMLERWGDLVNGDFSNNPYLCDCSSQWMVDVLVPLLINTQSNSTVDNMICKKPADLRGLTIKQLYNTSKTLVCPDSLDFTELPETSNMAIILGIMIGILATFPLVLVVVLLWKRGYFARCRSRKSEDSQYDETEDLYL